MWLVKSKVERCERSISRMDPRVAMLLGGTWTFGLRTGFAEHELPLLNVIVPAAAVLLCVLQLSRQEGRVEKYRSYTHKKNEKQIPTVRVVV